MALQQRTFASGALSHLRLRQQLSAVSTGVQGVGARVRERFASGKADPAADVAFLQDCLNQVNEQQAMANATFNNVKAEVGRRGSSSAA